jgi:flagellar biosynthetic protein FliR
LTVVGMTLPFLSTPLQNLFLEGIETSRSVPRVWAAKTAPAPPTTLAPLIPPPSPLAPAGN